MNKLKDKPLSSKLSQLAIKSIPEKENKLNEKKSVTSLGGNNTLSVTKTFLLGTNDWKKLESLVQKLNSLSSRKVKRSEVIRALIQLGDDIDENKLLNVMRKIRY